MLRLPVYINHTPVDALLCVRLAGGPDDGWNDYRCQCGSHTFTIRHNRPDGYWALIATAASMLAEAGIGVQQVSNWDKEA
jgi:hypothetical protein